MFDLPKHYPVNILSNISACYRSSFKYTNTCILSETRKPTWD